MNTEPAPVTPKSDPAPLTVSILLTPEQDEALDQFCSDQVVTLVESGLYSWFRARKYVVATATCELRGENPHEGEDWLPWRPYGPAEVRAALLRLAQGPVEGLHESIRARLAVALLVPEAADFDVNDADIIAQVATFGEVVYG